MRLLAALAAFSLFSATGPTPAESSNEAFVRLRETTVHIAIGSGFIAKGGSGKSYLVTNWHVCNAGSWLGKMRGSFEGGELVEGTIVKRDALSDLCASRIAPRKQALSVAKYIHRGQEVYTRGYPSGVLSESEGKFIDQESWNYTYSIDEVGECFTGSKKQYDGMGRVGGCSVVYRDNLTSLYSRPGSSGSPVVNADGNLVGVISSWIGDRDAGGMVRLEQVQKFLSDL